MSLKAWLSPRWFITVMVMAGLAVTSIGECWHCLAEWRVQSTSCDWYERAQASSVAVVVDGTLSLSGVLVGEAGAVVTSAHGVAQPGVRLEVMVPGRGRWAALCVAVDWGHDLALLQFGIAWPVSGCCSGG